MNSSLKWILIGGGAAYLLFHEQIQALLSGSAVAPATTGGSAPTPALPAAPAAPAVPSPAEQTKARLLAWGQAQPQYATQGNALTTHQWNYGYQQMTNVAGPSPDKINEGDGNRFITIDQYWSDMQKAGLSGLRGLRSSRRAWRY